MYIGHLSKPCVLLFLALLLAAPNVTIAANAETQQIQQQLMELQTAVRTAQDVATQQIQMYRARIAEIQKQISTENNPQKLASLEKLQELNENLLAQVIDHKKKLDAKAISLQKILDQMLKATK